jgi:2'-5' RNA ligase
MHLTLAFLGETKPDRVAAITTALSRAAARVPPLHLTAAGLGCFPSAARARVLWAGVEGDTDGLGALQRQVAAGLHRLGHVIEARAFRPHVTLARSRTPIDEAGVEAVKALLARPYPPFGSWRALEVELIQSHLAQGGSRYTTIAAAPLLAEPARQPAAPVASFRSTWGVASR